MCDGSRARESKGRERRREGKKESCSTPSLPPSLHCIVLRRKLTDALGRRGRGKDSLQVLVISLQRNVLHCSLWIEGITMSLHPSIHPSSICWTIAHCDPIERVTRLNKRPVVPCLSFLQPCSFILQVGLISTDQSKPLSIMLQRLHCWIVAFCGRQF